MPPSVLDAIKPRQKNLIIDLVRDAGVDVSPWSESARGDAGASMNPKYCYEWAFVQPGKVVVLNLWHAHMKESDHNVYLAFNNRKFLDGRPHLRPRAERFEAAVIEAIRARLPIRVVISEGEMGDPDDPSTGASRVRFRHLDPVHWSVISYDPLTGDGLLMRGSASEFADQFTVADQRLLPERTVSVTVPIRDATVRRRVLMRANGRCEYCSQPGFKMADGRIYLETHHIVPLCEGGPDTTRNVIALCANHHREAHFSAEKDEMRRRFAELNESKPDSALVCALPELRS